MMKEQTANARMATKLLTRLLPIQIPLAAVDCQKNKKTEPFAVCPLGLPAKGSGRLTEENRDFP